MIVQENTVERVNQAFQSRLPTVFFQLALPYRNPVPAHLREFQLHFDVSPTVSVNLRFPEVNIRPRHYKRFAALMSMPETSVYENAGSIFPQHNIWFSRQPRMIEPVSETIVPQVFTHDNLRLGILSMNRCHAMMSLFWSQWVGHFLTFHNFAKIEIIVERYSVFIYFCISKFTTV